MKEPVVIKSYQMNGLKLVMDAEISFENILNCLAGRLDKSRKFFKDIPKGLLFEGRKLSMEEQEKILDCIQKHSDINIVCIMEEDQELQEKINEKVMEACLELEKRKLKAGLIEDKPEPPKEIEKESALETTKKAEEKEEKIKEIENIEKIEKTQNKLLKKDKTEKDKLQKQNIRERVSSQMAEDPGLFYKGNLRSGQVLESDKSIIFLGDIKPGAHLISKGNVIVLGSLRGNVFAGAAGNKKAFVVALDMQPVQVRIDDFIARSPDEPEKEKDKQAKIAFLEGENIYIEPICKEVFHDIQV